MTLGFLAGQISSSAAPPNALTSAQVSSLVASSMRISSVPENLTPPLSQVGRDVPSTVLSGIGSCINPVKLCFYGAVKAKKTIVLTGDSHALMWAPPMASVASVLGYRLGVTWLPSCPIAVIAQATCTSYKTKVDATIAAMRPSLVVVAERTSALVAQPSWPSSDATWAQGVAGRLLRLEKSSKVAMLLDTPSMPAAPAACLAIDPMQVERCGASLVPQNPLQATKTQAERDAVSFAHATAIDPLPWLCGTQCSPILGTTVAYYDQTHIATSWAMRLTTVLRAKVAPLLTR
jgi:hypothetical protein